MIRVEDLNNPNGSYVGIGDWVHYKLGTEKCGKITDIVGNHLVVNGMHIPANRCWVE